MAQQWVDDPNFGDAQWTGGPPSGSAAAATLKKKAPGFIRRNLPPAAGMTAGAAAGGGLATLLAPETGGLSLIAPVVGAALGAGGENVLYNKTMPESLGANPKESAASSFLWGFGPELLGTGLAAGAERRAARVGSEAVERGTENFEKEVGERAASTHKSLADALAGQEPTMNDVSAVRSRLGASNGARPTGEARQAQTFAYRDAALGPIDRQRRTLGDALGKQYSKLKGITAPVADVQDFQNIGDTIRANTNSPISAPVNKLLDETQRLAPPLAEPGQVQGFTRPLDTQASIRAREGEPLPATATTDEAARSALSENLYQTRSGSYIRQGEQWKPPTLDKLLDIRQRATNMLTNAKGGDIHALLDLRQAVDDKLSSFLPDVSKERAAYKSFSDLYPWRDINQLRRQPTGSDIAKWAFGRKPEQALEIVQNATPAEKTVLRQAYADRALAGVDPDLPAPQQMKQIRKALAPDIQNGIIKDLYGSVDHKDLRNIIYTPMHREQWAKQFESPRGRHAYTAGFTDAARAGSGSEKASAQAGLQRFIETLPPEGQQAFASMTGTVAMPSARLPVLLSPEAMAKQGIKGALTQGKGQMEHYAGRRVGFALPYAASRMAIGGSTGATFAAANAGAFAAILGTSMGYRAAMKLGGASAVARLYAAPMGRAAAKASIQFLSAIGARSAESAVQGAQ